MVYEHFRKALGLYTSSIFNVNVLAVILQIIVYQLITLQKIVVCVTSKENGLVIK